MRRLCAFAAWLLVVAVFLSFTSCSSHKRVRTAYDARKYISEHDLKHLPQSNIPVVVNERVVAWMEYFQGAGRKHFKRYLERSARYLPLMQAILREQGMPTDLVYIALIESGFNNHAYSHAAAVGPWQFIRTTGQMYGLKVNAWIDERRDPIRATYAAARLFRDLYGDYGDWYLAMVGYNAGPGRVKKAMEVTGSRDFWVWADHRKALRAETRDYVPKFLAAMIMAKSPEKFGFTDLNYQQPWEHESAAVETQTDLSVIAKCAGVSEDAIADLNPHLMRGVTPPDQRHYKVRLPKGRTKDFLLAYAKIPEDERITIVRHKVRRGDTMYKIARKYGVSTGALASANGISRRAKLRRGKTLVIPVGSHAKYAKYSEGSSSSRSSQSKLIRYKVRRGDTLSTIASKYPGVTVSKLKRWNRMGRRTHIRAGQRLKIYTKGSGTSYASRASSGGNSKTEYHKVRRGETLGTIARKYGTSTKQLMALNGIKNPKSLRAGQNLKVRAGSQSSSSSSSRSSTGRYRVQAGDTPSEIAERHGMSTKELMAMNDIDNPTALRTGMNLKVRGGDADSSSSSGRTTAVDLEDVEAPTGSGIKKLEKFEKVKVTKRHKVRSGETVGGIAARYGMSTKELMAANGIRDARKVRAGQTLKVTSTEKRAVARNTTAIPLEETSSPRSRSASRTVHTVKKGETLGTIAVKYGTTTKKLMALNGLKDARYIRIGQKLKVSGSHARASSAETTAIALGERKGSLSKRGSSEAHASAASSRKHKVKSGETLGGIAARYGISTKQLMAWNNIKNPRSVRAGRDLVIKGGKSSSSKSGEKSSMVKESGKPIKLASAQAPSSRGQRSITYRVKNGESLWTIARKHNVTIAQLQQWNDLDDPSSVRAGTSLKIMKN